LTNVGHLSETPRQLHEWYSTTELNVGQLILILAQDLTSYLTLCYIKKYGGFIFVS